jgi:YbbR domain-containing protein
MKTKYSKKEELDRIKDNVLDNFSYKVVALFIALILWLSILNRRDFIVTKDLDVDFITASDYIVTGQSNAVIKVKVSGPQPLLKKFKESSQVLAFDMSDKKEGFYDVEINASRVEVPAGIKIIGIKPSSVRLEIIEKTKESK